MFRERLKRYRQRRGLSGEAVGALMGFAPNTISKIEHGHRKVTVEEAVRLAEILGVSLLDLAGVPPQDQARVAAARWAQQHQDMLMALDALVQTHAVFAAQERLLVALRRALAAPALDPDPVAPG